MRLGPDLFIMPLLEAGVQVSVTKHANNTARKWIHNTRIAPSARELCHVLVTCTAYKHVVYLKSARYDCNPSTSKIPPGSEKVVKLEERVLFCLVPSFIYPC